DVPPLPARPPRTRAARADVDAAPRSPPLAARRRRAAAAGRFGPRRRGALGAGLRHALLRRRGRRPPAGGEPGLRPPSRSRTRAAARSSGREALARLVVERGS